MRKAWVRLYSFGLFSAATLGAVVLGVAVLGIGSEFCAPVLADEGAAGVQVAALANPALNSASTSTLASFGIVEGASADLVKISTPDYQVNHSMFEPVLGTYTFKVGWEGIPAALLTFTTEQQGLYYKVSATARTYSGIDLFYKLRYRAEGLISALDFSPIRSRFEKNENSKQRITEISYLEDRKVHTLRSGNGKEDEVLEFSPENNMLEPFSAAFVARGLDWKVGDTRHFDTFNGKSRYLISLSATDRVSLKVNGESRDVFVIEPRVHNLTSAKDNKKLRQAYIYVTADSKREILKITSDVFVGSVSAWLDSFEPSSLMPGGTAVAQRQSAVNSEIQ